MKRTTWIFLVALVLVLTAYLLLKFDVLPAAKPTASATATSMSYLFSGSDGILVSLQVQDRQGNSVLMERDATGSWFINFPVEAVADQGLAGAAETQVGSLRIASTFQATPDLGAAGLLAPNYTIRLGYDSGSEHGLEVGSMSPTGRGYYVRLDQDAVYLVNMAGIDALVNLVSSPPYPPTQTPTQAPTETATPELNADGTLTSTPALP